MTSLVFICVITEKLLGKGHRRVRLEMWTVLYRRTPKWLNHKRVRFAMEVTVAAAADNGIII